MSQAPASQTELAPVSMSASAARRLSKILGADDGAALRISVKGGGCSGFQYAFDIEKARAEDDLVVEIGAGGGLGDPHPGCYGTDLPGDQLTAAASASGRGEQRDGTARPLPL